MALMKRLQLAAMFLIVVALPAGTSALAEDWTTTPVPLTNTGAEPNASGEATLTDVTFRGFYFDEYGFLHSEYDGHLTVTCQGLTPGKVYRIGPIYPANPLVFIKGKPVTAVFFEFKASRKGTGGYSGSVAFRDGYFLWVERKNGTNGTAVLMGTIPRQ